MSEWSKVQEKISEDDLIAQVEMRGITPARIGGYNAQPYSPELGLLENPRTQAVKGLWRWWARTLLAGAKMSAGESLPESLSDLDEEISKLFGSTKSSSKFILQLAVNNRETNEMSKMSNLVKKVPRIRLLSMGRTRGGERYYFPQITVTLRANRTRKLSKEEVMFGLSSLLVSLVFSGIGSVVNRGFGKVKITDVQLGPRLKNEKDAKELKETLFELYKKTGGETIVKLKKFLQKSLESASAYKGYGTGIKGVHVRNIPPYSVLLPDCNPPIFRIEAFHAQRGKNVISILECIGKSTMKTEWKRIKGINPKRVGKDFHTWVLGLPRFQEPPYEENGRKVNKLTGYLFNGSREKRRQSPIGFTVLELDGNDYWIVVYGFLTSEYGQQLSKMEHVGIHVVGGHIKGVIGRVDSIERTYVQTDITSKGIQTPFNVIRVMHSEDAVSIYQKCFDAAYQFVKKIVGSCLR